VDLYWGVKEALYAGGFPLHAPADAPLVAQAHADIVEALRRGQGTEVARLLHDHYGEAERRFGAVRRADGTGQSSGGASGREDSAGGPHTVATLIQAALLGFRGERAA
jgi:hypothetical protein